MKVPWTAGNYISDFTCRDWIRPYIEFPVINGLHQVRIKAGCKAYYPDSFDENNNPKFSVYTLDVDRISNISASVNNTTYCIYLYILNSTTFAYTGMIQCCMGTSPELTPSAIGSTTHIRYWNTSTNRMQYSNNGGTDWTVDDGVTLPIAIAEWTKGIGFTSFTPFEFCGCMGNGVFTLPFEADIASGFDTYGNPVLSHQSYTAIQNIQLTWNGTYNNKIFIRKSQSGIQFINNNQMNISGNRNLYIQSATPTTTISADWYNPENNIVQYYSASEATWTQTYNWFIAECGWNGTNKRFTMFKPFTNIDGLTGLPSLAKFYF